MTTLPVTITSMTCRFTRFRVVAILAALVLSVSGSAGAQILDLEDPRPPATSASSYSMVRAAQLERAAGRASGFDDAAVPGTSDTEIIRQSKNAWRMIAASLLRMPAPEDSMAVVMGHTLVDGGDAIDATLDQILSDNGTGTLPGPQRRACFESLIRFLERADLPMASPDAGPSRLNAARRALEPLLEAIATIEETTPVSGWPSVASSAHAASGDVAAMQAIIDAWADAACPPPTEIADALRRHVGRLSRSDEDAASRTQTSPGVHATGLPVLMEYGRAISRASWLRQGDKHLLHWDALSVALDRIAQATSLSEVLDLLNRINLTTACFNQLEEMASTRVPSSMRFRVQAVYEFLRELDPTRDVAYQDWRLDQLRQALLLAMDARRLPAVEARVDMRRIAKEIQTDYLRAEASLLVTLSASSFDPSASRADPAYISLAARTRRELEDLRRVRGANHWIDQMAERDRNLQRELKKALLDLRAQLKDFLVADDVSARLEMLERDVVRFVELPQENALTQPGSTARQVVGQHTQAMSTRIAVARRAWVNAWAKNRGIDEATRTMDDLYRWSVALDASVRLRSMLDDDGYSGEAINAWAGWQCDPESMRRDLVGLERSLNSVARAFETDSSRGRTRLIDQLERRAAPALLAGCLLMEQTRFQSLPRNATGTLCQVVFPPTTGAWEGENAERYARFVRYRREVDAIEDRARRVPEALRQYVWFEAALLME